MRYLAAAVLVSCVLFPVPSALAQQDQFLFAYKLMQRGDLAEAATAFDEYLDRYPQAEQRGDALYFRAALHRRDGELEEAVDLLDAAAAPSRVPGYLPVLLRGQLLTDLGRFDEAVTALEALEGDDLPEAARPSVALLRGLAYRGAGNLAASATSLQKAAEAGGDTRPRALLELARNHAAAGDDAAAMAALDAALDLEDSAVAPEAALLAGDLAFRVGDFDRAAAAYRLVVEQHQTSPQFGPAATGVLWTHLQAGEPQAVIDAHGQFAAALPDDQRPVAAFLLGSAHQALGEHEAAATHLTDYLATDDPPLGALALYRLAVSQAALGRVEALRDTVATLEARYPDAPQRLDAAFLLATTGQPGDDADAAGPLAAFIDDGPDNPYYSQALLRRSVLLEQQGNLDAAAADLRRYLDAADPDAADRPRVTLRLVDLSHRLERYDDAVSLADALLAGEPEPAVEQEALYRKGEAQTRQGEFAAALETFDTLVDRHPAGPFRAAADLRRGLLLSRLNRPDRAMEVLTEVADNATVDASQRVAALRIIAARQRETDRPDDAASTLRRMERLGGLDTLTGAELLWLADHELSRDDADAAIATLDTLNLPGRTLAPAERSAALYHRGRAQFQRRDFADAHRSFAGVVALGQGHDLHARLGLARAKAAQGDLDPALRELSDLINVDDTAVRAAALYETGVTHRRRADRLYREDRPDDAREALTEARASLKRLVLLYLTVDELYPLQPDGLLELHEIALALGEPDAALKEVRELLRAYPDTPYATYAEAVLAEDERRRPDDALVLLQKLEGETLPEALKRRVKARVKRLEALQ